MRQIWQMSSFVTTVILAFAFQLPAQTAKSATGGSATDKTPDAIAANPASTTVSAKSAAGTVSSARASATSSTTPAAAAMKAKSLAMPLFFEANKGQADPSVRFLTRSKGYTLFVTPTETVLAGAPPTPITNAKAGDAAKPGNVAKTGKAPVVTMQLAGANASPTVSGVDELHGKVNYLIGRDSSKWATNVPLYSKVSVAGVYPGVDLLFHGNERQLEYDFVVAPGADPSKIAFRIRGAKHIEIDANGNLVLRAGASEFQMAKPAVYQEIAQVRRPIEGSFVRKGRNEIAFRVGEYDRSQPLVIDPGIGYATFLGGAGADESEDLEVDNSVPGSPKLYFGGYTADTTTFPETGHSLIGAAGGAAYAFVAKIDPTITSDPGGTASLDFLTFIGGSVLLPGNPNPACYSLAEHVSLDESQGSSDVEPVVGGVTTCGDYPGTPTQAVEGVETTFVTRLTSLGSGIDSSIILGGNGANVNEFATVDSAGNVTATGVTQSTNLPVSSNAYVSQLNNGGSGAGDCYFMLLAREDLAMTYATYLNVGNGTTGGVSGTQSQIGCGGIKDATGKVDIGGVTFSPIAFNLGVGGASIANGFETTFPAGATKASFALQIDPTASGIAGLTYATYFGGGGNTNLQTGAVNLGNSLVALAGWTESNSAVGDIPLKNAYQTTNNGTGGNQQTGWAMILDASKTGANSLVFSTYFGGSSGVDQINVVSYDSNDSTSYRLILGGQTQSSDFPMVNSLQTLQGTQNAFVAEMNAPLEGQGGSASLAYSTLIGGGAIQATEGDKITGVGVDLQDNVYAAGRTVSPNFYANTTPTTDVNGFQTACSSCSPAAAIQPDAVIFSLGLASGATLNSIVVSPATATVQVGKTVQFTAQGYYSDGSIRELTDSVSWSTGNAGIASVSEGLVTGNTVGGPLTVFAIDGTVNSTASVTVVAATSYALTVTTSGTGFGVETSTPAGISCPPTCSAEFAVNAQITLTAVANGGSSFTGWSGGGCSGTGTCTVTMSAEESVTASYTTVPSYQLLLSIFGPGAGTVTSAPSGINCTSTCSGNYNPGTVVTLTETPATGSTFAGWGGPCGGTGSSCTATMNSMEDVSATFNAVTYLATVTTSGAGIGTVTSQPSGINCPPTCSAQFGVNSSVTLNETAAAGSAFAGWSGACGGTNGSCPMVMTGAQSATATFVPTTNLTLTIVLAGTAYGAVTSSTGLTCSDTSGVVAGTCSITFPSGTAITLGETPGTGSVFGGWSGGTCSGTTNTCQFSLTANTTVIATFNNGTGTFLLSIQPAAGETGSGTVTSNAGINCSLSPAGVSGACSGTFNSGAIVTLYSTPAPGSTFTSWTGGPCSSNIQPCNVLMASATTVNVTYTSVNYTLTVQLPGSGSGTITSNPAGIACPPTCSANFPENSQIALTETPASGSAFTGWSGQGCVGTNPICALTITQSEGLTATFSPAFVLTVTDNGTGSGTVTSNPAGINCVTGSTTGCSASFVSGTQVLLTYTVGSGSTFAGWTGGNCSGTGVCDVTMNAAQSVTATFAANTTFALTVNEAGTGSGTVSGTPAGILCPSTCSANYASGTVVTLTATPNSGSTFAGWSGNPACSGTGTCTITMSAAQSVTATFNTTTTFPLTVTIMQNALNEGSVASAPAGISCPSTCTANFSSGAPVTLTATPNAGSTFTGWSGNASCSGTGTCTITMSAAELVTANFTVQQFALTVTDAGTGTGTVTSQSGLTPAIDCVSGSTANCSASYNSGQQVTLTATPGTGSAFAGWSGACSGTGSCVVTMSAAKSVTATFNTTTTFALTVTDAGTGSGTVTSQSGLTPAIDCVTGSTSGCSATYPSGQQVTLTVTPGAGSTFAGWSGACTGTGSCAVTMSAAQSVTATFNSTAATDLRAVTAPFTDDGSSPVTLTWNPAFPDTNYTAVCTAETTQSDFLLPLITAQTATTITVIPTEGGATPGTVECIAIPDSDTSDIRHGRQQFQTSASAVEVDWATAFPDTNYTVACTAQTADTGVSYTSVISDLEAGFVSVDIGGIGQGTMECIAVPDSDSSTVRHGRTSFSTSGIQPTVNVPWNSAFPDTNYAAACSDVELNTLVSDASIAIEAGSKATGSVTVLNEILSGTAHCLGLELPAQQFTLTITEAGTGTGTVTSQAGLSPAINCTTGSTTGCTSTYPSGTQVTLTETAGNSSTFAGWGGAECAGATCQVVVNSPLAVTATFNTVQYALAVTLAGTGSGSVVSVPEGIDCVPDGECQSNFNSGTQVTLTATAGSGSSFFGWSGGGCSGTGTCVVTMNAAVNVTATFNAGANFILTTNGGTATSVTTNPGGNIVVGLTVSGPVKETITLGCTSSAPQYLSCTITPTTVNLTGNGPTQVAIVLTSYCQGATPGPGPADNGRPRGPMPWIPQLPAAIAVLFLAMLSAGMIWSSGGRRRLALATAAMLLLVAGGMACGGLPKGPNGVTPAGNYVLTVTATAQGQAPQAVQINVQVN